MVVVAWRMRASRRVLFGQGIIIFKRAGCAKRRAIESHGHRTVLRKVVVRMRSDRIVGILKLGGRRERTFKRVSLETVLASCAGGKSVVGVRVTVTVEFGPVGYQQLLGIMIYSLTAYGLTIGWPHPLHHPFVSSSTRLTRSKPRWRHRHRRRYQ